VSDCGLELEAQSYSRAGQDCLSVVHTSEWRCLAFIFCDGQGNSSYESEPWSDVLFGHFFSLIFLFSSLPYFAVD